jgi:hypothetical protein
MTIKGLNNFFGKRLYLITRTLDMQVNPPIRKVLHQASYVIATGNSEDLGTETNPLDVARVPYFTMGDMG